MADRTCYKCGQVFRYPSHLKRHVQRKTPCDRVVRATDLTSEDLAKPFICPHCRRHFGHQSNLSHHIRHSCKASEVPTGTVEAQLAALQLEVEVLKQAARVDAQEGAAGVHSLSQVTHPAAASGHGDDHRVYHNTVHVNIHAPTRYWGEEDTSYLTTSEVGSILDHLHTFGNPIGDRVIQSIARAIWANPHHPENMTCKLKNKRDGTVLVHTETGWDPRAGQEIYAAMATKACTELNDKQDYYASPSLLGDRSAQVKAAFDCEAACQKSKALQVIPEAARMFLSDPESMNLPDLLCSIEPDI
jgi:hypothetical protein